ncbi:MAG: GNAT family N-acetyltransferase [Actinomycetaceae bacterium]|nr:GNAT family N-acetyltransferase [Actinomycetaceae bacterium]
MKLIGIDQWQLGVPSAQHFEADIAAQKGRVCEVDANIAAYCALSDTPSTFYPQVAGRGWTYPEAPYIQVNRLAVHQNYARQGLAGKLLGFALAEAQRRNHQQLLETGNSSLTAPWHVRLDTHPGNIRMHRLLENLGFTCAGTVNYPMPGETTRFCYEGFPSFEALPLEVLDLTAPATAELLAK